MARQVVWIFIFNPGNVTILPDEKLLQIGGMLLSEFPRVAMKAAAKGGGASDGLAYDCPRGEDAR